MLIIILKMWIENFFESFFLIFHSFIFHFLIFSLISKMLVFFFLSPPPPPLTFVISCVKYVFFLLQLISNWFYFQYYLKKSDVGKNRALASLEHLRELNSYVTVHAHTEILSEDFLKKFRVSSFSTFYILLFTFYFVFIFNFDFKLWFIIAV